MDVVSGTLHNEKEEKFAPRHVEGVLLGFTPLTGCIVVGLAGLKEIPTKFKITVTRGVRFPLVVEFPLQGHQWSGKDSPDRFHGLARDFDFMDGERANILDRGDGYCKICGKSLST